MSSMQSGPVQVSLLDNRDEDEWRGVSSSPYGIDFAPRKGRIPGANWIEWYQFMDTTQPIPYFKSGESARALCEGWTGCGRRYHHLLLQGRTGIQYVHRAQNGRVQQDPQPLRLMEWMVERPGAADWWWGFGGGLKTVRAIWDSR